MKFEEVENGYRGSFNQKRTGIAVELNFWQNDWLNKYCNNFK
uniref:Uncharacterized protein n=1 Tax=Meloidogyne enterolobii TaxID=390850 RepID=A0A6V7U1W5_MELEN|nr:unnamed protein product [Meloidogyne enterolobii]